MRLAICRTGIIPVETFPAADARAKIVEIIDGGPTGHGICMTSAIAPVGEREIVVNADKPFMQPSRRKCAR